MFKQFKFFKKWKKPVKNKKLKKKKWRKVPHQLLRNKPRCLNNDVCSIQNHYLQVHGTNFCRLHSADGEGIGREI